MSRDDRSVWAISMNRSQGVADQVKHVHVLNTGKAMVCNLLQGTDSLNVPRRIV